MKVPNQQAQQKLLRLLAEESLKNAKNEEFMLHVMGQFVADKKRNDYLADALREIGEVPVYYVLHDAFLFITLSEITPPMILVSENPRARAWELFRKWGIIGGGSNQATQVFEDKNEAKRTYDIIIRDKKKKGYKPIF